MRKIMIGLCAIGLITIASCRSDVPAQPDPAQQAVADNLEELRAAARALSDKEVPEPLGASSPSLREACEVGCTVCASFSIGTIAAGVACALLPVAVPGLGILLLVPCMAAVTGGEVGILISCIICVGNCVAAGG